MKVTGKNIKSTYGTFHTGGDTCCPVVYIAFLLELFSGRDVAHPTKTPDEWFVCGEHNSKCFGSKCRMYSLGFGQSP